MAAGLRVCENEPWLSTGERWRPWEGGLRTWRVAGMPAVPETLLGGLDHGV